LLGGANMKHRLLSWWPRFALALPLLLVLGTLATSCAPEPRNVPCTNDGQCQKASEAFRYCLQSRCVQCVSSSSCGNGNSCIDGECVIRCKDDHGCPQRQVCREETCRPL
jgi:peptidoglycan-associated lipoprotein